MNDSSEFPTLLNSEHALFRARVAQLIDNLNLSKIDYRFVGSLAVDSFLFNGIPEYSHEKDIDLLVLSPGNDIDADSLFAGVGVKSSQNPFGVDLVIGQYVEIRGNIFYLRFRDCMVEFPSRILDPYEFNVDGLCFTTVPPMTLLHFYSIPGSLRSEDWNRALGLARWIRKNGDEGYPEDLYRNFHELATERQRRYTLLSLFWRMDRRRNVLGSPSLVEVAKKIPGVGSVLRKARRRVIGG